MSEDPNPYSVGIRVDLYLVGPAAPLDGRAPEDASLGKCVSVCDRARARERGWGAPDRARAAAGRSPRVAGRDARAEVQLHRRPCGACSARGGGGEFECGNATVSSQRKLLQELFTITSMNQLCSHFRCR